eukprot:jgi/Tetstr1/445649/TSEL_003454.t1
MEAVCQLMAVPTAAARGVGSGSAARWSSPAGSHPGSLATGRLRYTRATARPAARSVRYTASAPLQRTLRMRAGKEEGEGSAPDAGDEKDPPPLVVSLLGLIAAVMAGISVFYSIVFYAGGGIAYLVKDTITFTRKDFIPYSERRRLEAEAEEAQRSRDEAAGAGAAPDVRFSETLLPSSGKK